MIVILKFIHLLSLVIWIGGIIFLVSIGAPSIFKVLPREVAGDVLGEIFPKYLMMGYICSATTLLTLVIISLGEKIYPWGRMGLLTLMMTLTLYMGLVTASRTRDVRLQIRIADDPVQQQSLKTSFNSLHRQSVVLNILVLVSGLVVLFLMADPTRFSYYPLS